MNDDLAGSQFNTINSESGLVYIWCALGVMINIAIITIMAKKERGKFHVVNNDIVVLFLPSDPNVIIKKDYQLPTTNDEIKEDYIHENKKNSFSLLEIQNNFI